MQVNIILMQVKIILNGLGPGEAGNTMLAQEVLHTEQKENHFARVNLQS